MAGDTGFCHVAPASSVDPIRFQRVTKNLSADDDLWIQLLPAEALAEWRTKIAAGQPRIILYVGTLTLSHHPSIFCSGLSFNA
ncbi:MAG: hypothetical protein R2932_15925 [Caldilineaceae bacterium]